MMSSRPERIQKILSRAGLGSRRKCEGLIKAGRVTVNALPVSQPGTRARESEDLIEVDVVEIPSPEPKKYLMVNKPVDTITSTIDRRGRRTVMELLPSVLLEEYRLFPVGRLDKDSQGLILLTNDGFLAHRMLHPSHEVKREYIVVIEPATSPDGVRRICNRLDDVGGGHGGVRVALQATKNSTSIVRIVIHTGKKRQIRRSLEDLGYKVVSLTRTKFGTLELGNLETGSYRELLPDEVHRLYRQVGV